MHHGAAYTSRTAVMVCLLMALGGCAWTSQQVHLHPTLSVVPAASAKGRPVFVSVEDERPSQILGHKVPVGGGEIKTARDPAQVVREAFVTGLGQIGFAIADRPAATVPELNVELRAIDYKVTQGFWSGGLYVDVALKAICRVGDTIKYDQLFRGNHQENIQVVQSQANNEGYINDALSQAINGALRDPALLQCLAGSG